MTGRRWDVLAWSPAAVELFGDFARMAEDDRNILVFMFLDPRARRLFGKSWADEAKRMLAVFRTTHDLWPRPLRSSPCSSASTPAVPSSRAGGTRTTFAASRRA